MGDRPESALGTIAARIGYQLRRLDLMAMAQLRMRLSAMGLAPGRATATAYIAAHPGCDQTALAHALGVNRAGSTIAVDALVALGAVERRAGRDRRTNALHLTPAGHRLKARAEAETIAHEEEVFGVLEPAERVELARLIAKTRMLNRAPAERAEPRMTALQRRVG